MGAKRFGDGRQKSKKALILDSEPHRYQAAISDISGQDIKSHGGDPEEVIRCVRNWLSTQSRRANLPGATYIIERYRQYEADLPAICEKLRLNPSELEFNDLWETIVEWQDYVTMNDG